MSSAAALPVEEIHAAILRFLASCREPAVLEPGEEAIRLDGSNHLLECAEGRLTLQVWDARHNFSRHITGIDEQRTGRLELEVRKFGGRTGSLTLLDTARPANRALNLRGRRRVFREQFRRFLSRQFPGWRIAELSTEPDLENSLSSVYSRALIRHGSCGWAAIGAPPGAGVPGALTFGLVWLDYLRRRERRLTLEGLALYLPGGFEQTVCLRLRWLNPKAAQFAVFVYSDEGFEERIDPRDFGNLETHLESCRGAPGATSGRIETWVDRLCALPGVACVVRNDGAISLHVRGLEFARAARGELSFGLQSRRRAAENDLPEIEQLASGLAWLRGPEAPDRHNPLYSRSPELWLESQVRANLSAVDASLRPQPLYGQVPAFAAGERGVIDLLAVEHGGRLAVIELKASEDIHLPLQALDYWMRVKWHLDRGEFSRQGYFPRLTLTSETPRLLLVAPALAFHPSTERLLRYLAPEIPVTRIGLAVEWQERVQVVLRLQGALGPSELNS